MNRRRMINIATLTAVGTILMLGNVVAQQKQHASFKSLVANSKYTQQHVVDVGDAPGHQLRVFEIYRTYPADALTINGLKLKEGWVRGISNYTDGSGTNTTYGVYTMENGDQFFTKADLVAHSLGEGKLSTYSAGPITGGTGKLLGIKGVMRSVGTSNPKAGTTETQTDLEYWFQK
jgi:hypothetical protein